MASAELEAATVHPNARAFLDMISAAEGTTRYGYYTLVGGSRLQSLAQHPGIVVRLSSTLSSTAAGRYQFLKRTWDRLRSRLGLPDFGPHSQDLGALELIREKGALGRVLQGDAQGAIALTRRVWASFPGAGYGQGERSMSFMLNAFARAGGGVPGTVASVEPVPLPPPSSERAPIMLGPDVNQASAVSGGALLLIGLTIAVVYIMSD